MQRWAIPVVNASASEYTYHSTIWAASHFTTISAAVSNKKNNTKLKNKKNTQNISNISLFFPHHKLTGVVFLPSAMLFM